MRVEPGEYRCFEGLTGGWLLLWKQRPDSDLIGVEWKAQDLRVLDPTAMWDEAEGGALHLGRNGETLSLRPSDRLWEHEDQVFEVTFHADSVKGGRVFILKELTPTPA